MLILLKFIELLEYLSLQILSCLENFDHYSLKYFFVPVASKKSSYGSNALERMRIFPQCRLIEWNCLRYTIQVPTQVNTHREGKYRGLCDRAKG